MAKIIIPAGDETYVAHQANTTYVLKAGTTIDTTDQVALNAYAPTSHRTFQINGTLTGSEEGISAGNWLMPPENLLVQIGETGKILVDMFGISMGANRSSIVNDGYIGSTSQGYAVKVIGDGNMIDNAGNMSGYKGVLVTGDDNGVVNSGKILASTEGVVFTSVDGEANSLNNSGFINAYVQVAVSGGDGEEHIVNSGRMKGRVELHDGDDTFISKGGRVTGVINGGDGDDTYVIDSAKLNLVEDASHGFDRVRSTVSYVMDANIEEARLTGKANINLTGTANGDLLYGNNGVNKIVGGTGTDFINGNRGNDTLTGGPASGVGDVSDFFIFRTHSGRDTITDFQDGTDYIDLGGYAGIDDFSDLAGRIRQVGDDVVIRLFDGDSITLIDTDKKTIGIEDFNL